MKTPARLLKTLSRSRCWLPGLQMVSGEPGVDSSRHPGLCSLCQYDRGFPTTQRHDHGHGHFNCPCFKER